MTQKESAMTWRTAFIRLSALCFIAVIPGLANKPMAAQAAIAPSEYPLSEVVFEYGTSGPQNDGVKIRIAGSGKGSRVEYSSVADDRTSEFAVDPQEVFHLLELCYRGQPPPPVPSPAPRKRTPAVPLSGRETEGLAEFAAAPARPNLAVSARPYSSRDRLTGFLARSGWEG